MIKIGHLLLVEDDADDVLLSKEAMQAAGVECNKLSVVPNLAETVKRLREFPADVVLLDLFHGCTRGLEALDIVRAATDAVIILLTGSIGENFAVAAILRGADDFIHKECLTGDLLRSRLSATLARRAIIQKVAVIEKKISEV